MIEKSRLFSPRVKVACASTRYARAIACAQAKENWRSRSGRAVYGKPSRSDCGNQYGAKKIRDVVYLNNREVQDMGFNPILRGRPAIPVFPCFLDPFLFFFPILLLYTLFLKQQLISNEGLKLFWPKQLSPQIM